MEKRTLIFVKSEMTGSEEIHHRSSQAAALLLNDAILHSDSALQIWSWPGPYVASRYRMGLLS